MQIVIDIPEDLHKMIFNENKFDIAHSYRLANCVKNGTPLSRCKFEKTRYRSIDQTGESYDDGVGWRCSVCCNVWKDEHVGPRWIYCPKCASEIISVEEVGE